MLRYGAGFIGLAVLLIGWEIAVRLFEIPWWLLPPPSAVALTGWEWREPLVGHSAITLWRAMQGFGWALIIGVPTAALLVSSELLWRAVYPILAGLQAVPKNALAPLLIVWFGVGDMSKVMIAFLIALFPIVVNTASGMALVERDKLHLMKLMRASRLDTFWHVRLPNALPYLFAACKIAITLAIVGAVIGEFVGADSGLGYLIIVSSSELRTDVAFVAILILAALGMILFWLTQVVERLAMPWCRTQGGGITL